MKMILMAGAAALAMGAAMAPVSAQTATTAAKVAVPNNVLLADWKGPYKGVPPWDQVKPEQFDQAIQFAIDELKRESAEIANNPAPPTFANTIEASDKTGERISNVLSVFSVMTDNMSSPAYEALDKKWSPLLSAAFDEISLDPKYFARVETLYNQRDSLGLDAKQMRLLTRTYDSLVRRGVKLDEPKKDQLKVMNKELSSLFSEFNSRLLKDEGTWIVATEAEMAGIPDDIKQAAAALAKDKGLGAGQYAIRNTRSAADPVLSFASNRALRQKVWQAFVNRGRTRWPRPRPAQWT